MKPETQGTPTLRGSEIVELLAKQLKLPKRTVKRVIDGLAPVAGAALKGGKRVQIKGVGLLTVREVKAPAKPGAPTKRVVLKPAKTFKSQAGV